MFVANDKDNLHVSYKTSGNWFIKEAQLCVLDDAPPERLSPGSAPRKAEGIETRECQFVVPLSNLGFEVTCGVRVDVEQVDEVPCSVEVTAYGFDPGFTGLRKLPRPPRST